MQENTNHFEKKRNIQKSLEDDWSRSLELKHIRQDEERRFLRYVDESQPKHPEADRIMNLSSTILFLSLESVQNKTIKLTGFQQYTILTMRNGNGEMERQMHPLCFNKHCGFQPACMQLSPTVDVTCLLC